MTDVMQSYNYNTLYAYQQQARLQGFGTSANQGYGGETSAAPSEANPSLANGSHEIPQIRGHVNVSMAHLQQEQQMPKLETDAQQLTQQVPTNTQPSQQPNQLDQSMTYHQQQPPPQQQQQQQQQPGASQTSGESMNMKKYYDNDEDEDTIIDEHFNKSFASESRTRLRHPSTFPASFYTQSASPQRSSSTSGYNGSLPGSVSPSSNPYAPGFPNQAVSQLYAAQQAAQSGFHPTTSPLATTNNGTTTAAATEWPYSSQYQQAFSHQQYQSTNTQATATTPTSTLQSHHAYNQLAYPFTHQQEQHHRTPAFATGFPQY